MAASPESVPGPTKPIYQYDETLRTQVVRTTLIRPFSELAEHEQAAFKQSDESTFAVETNETIFYAQGGGQPFDIGYMSWIGDDQKTVKFFVDAVRYGNDGRILHFGHFSDPTATFPLGSMLEQHIDGARRDLNSRIHTAGHTIALSVRRLAETTHDLRVTEVKAQHYPDVAFVEFHGIIDSKHKDAIQNQATKFVQEALPVKLYWYKPEELAENGVITAEGIPIVAGVDGNVRVVDIVGAGAYPCGGTHVPSTSHVGEIVIKGIKGKKGITKISYSVGGKT